MSLRYDLRPVKALAKACAEFDCLIAICDSPSKLGRQLGDLQASVNEYAKLDRSLLQPYSASLVACSAAPSGRLVVSNCGSLNDDSDDARRLCDAAATGVKRAVAAGSTRPLLALAELGSLPKPEDNEAWSTDRRNCRRCCLLGAMQQLYVPLQAREAGKSVKVEKIGYLIDEEEAGDEAAVELERQALVAMETGRTIARDIGGSDPERMAAQRIVERIREEIGSGDPCVSVEVEDSVDKQRYPLMAAVDRCASDVSRHSGRVVHLSYEGKSSESSDIVYLVGKGITYDTGGADVKAGGHMAGMCRDKCGAAAVVGFFRLLQLLKPPKLRAYASLAFVRNSIGSNAYVADEIIESRAGVRVKVGNTDAEGRMVMADLLCLAKEKVAAMKDSERAQLFTVATLTGHAVLACGFGYTAVMDNGPARRKGTAGRLQLAGSRLGDMIEVSTIRRDDYAIIAGQSEAEDILQCNNEPSSRTPRGHQFPAAFMIKAAGLDKHSRSSQQPIAYSHIDVAGSAGEPPKSPTAAPLLALAQRYALTQMGL